MKQLMIGLVVMLAACTPTEKEKSFTLNGIFIDSTGAPTPHVRFLLITERSGRQFNPFNPNDVITQHTGRTDSAGRFSQLVSWRSGDFFTVSSYPDSIAPYFIVGCSAEAQGNTCRLKSSFSTAVSITVQRSR
jgi:hypothetical protein